MVKSYFILSSAPVHQIMEAAVMDNGFKEKLCGICENEMDSENCFMEDVESSVLQDVGFCLWSPGFMEELERDFMGSVHLPCPKSKSGDGISVSQVSDGEMLINDQEKPKLQVNLSSTNDGDELQSFIGGIIEECIERVMEHVCDCENRECSKQNCRDSDHGIRGQNGVGINDAENRMDRTNDDANLVLDHVIGLASYDIRNKENGQRLEYSNDPLIPLLSLHKKSVQTLNEFDRNKDLHITAMNMIGSGRTASGCPHKQILSESDQRIQLPSLKTADFDSKSESLTPGLSIAGDFHFSCVNPHESNGIMGSASNGHGPRLSERSGECTCDIEAGGEKVDNFGGNPSKYLSKGNTAAISSSNLRGYCVVHNGSILKSEDLHKPHRGEKLSDHNGYNSVRPKVMVKETNSGTCSELESQLSTSAGLKHFVKSGAESSRSEVLNVENGAITREKSNSDSPQSIDDPDLVWDSDYDVIKDFNECLLEAERFPEISQQSDFCECLDEDEMKKKKHGSRLPSIMETSDESMGEEEDEVLDEEPMEVDVFDGASASSGTVIRVEYVTVGQRAAGDTSAAGDDETVAHDNVTDLHSQYHSELLPQVDETRCIPVQSIEDTASDLVCRTLSSSEQEIPPSLAWDQDSTSKQSMYIPKLYISESGEISPISSDSSGISPRDLDVLQNRTKKLLHGHSAPPVTMSVEISDIQDGAGYSGEPSPATTHDSGYDFRRKSRDLALSESSSENIPFNWERSSYYTCDDTGKIVSPGEKFEKSLLFAIQSLDSLNEQIVQFIFTPKSVEFNIDNEFSPKDREALKSSMAIMRRLLVDAQVKFRKMVDDNRQLATRIDGSILSANQEMQELRQELQDTNKRLSQLGQPQGQNGVHEEFQNGDGKGRRLSEAEQEISTLQDDNTKYERQINSLLHEIKELKCTRAILNEQPSLGDLKLELMQYQQELVRAKEALQAMKSDRKRLKAEKVDLLSQMRQLYQTLEEKEGELREFIRNYELRMRESDESIKQLAVEKDDAEREKWEILKRARDAAERVVILKSEVDEKNTEIQHLEDELAEARAQIHELKDMAHKQKTASTSDTGISSGTDAQTPSEEQLPTMATYYESPPPSARSVKSDMCTVITNLSSRITGSSSSDNLRRLGERSRSAEDVATDMSIGTLSSSGERQKKKKKMMTGFSSLSRMFGRSKNRKSVLYAESIMSIEDESAGPSSPRVSTLNEENYSEKLQTVNQLKDIPLVHWKAHHVLAWLEIVMSMPRYGRQCAENIKSGKILSDMSDSDLESALGVTNYLHRKKLRLAIDDLRDPSQVRYPDAGTIDHVWVAQVWMRDIGLPQYSAAFEAHHVDGRVLSSLSKKEMERCMQITRKFHQASILHGVELLRRVNFNKEVLTQRRSQCETFNCDPLVWTNERLIQWVHSIDLQEYAPNLLESGVNGAMLVLESSFNAETMAAALAIPPSKSIIRRHLTTELEALLKPARIAAKVKTKKRNMSGSLGKSFERSFKGPGEKEDGKKRLSFRGSLGRAFGRKVKRDLAVGLPEMLEEPLVPEKRSHSHEAIGTAV